MDHLNFPGLGAKWAIGSIALFHTAVASMAIGFAFFVTVAQIIGYINKDRRYDHIAKRVQLIHVCIYNIGTVNAIGLVFLLSGLYPQFWSQIFVQFYWVLIVEEFCFFLLATTLTFHYFFWDRMWGHKKLHIFLGALLTPLFFLQFYLINGLGGFMLTPGVGEASLSLREGILGWDRLGFYNPSFLMLTAHRALANVAYGGFTVAGICGVILYLSSKNAQKTEFYESSGRLAFYIGFTAFLSLPIVGYFYAHVLKNHAHEAYANLMWGRGDIVAGGIDWWWLKHLCVVSMLGLSLAYFRSSSRQEKPFVLPAIMVYSITGLYIMFYMAMGMVMTWSFFWWMLFTGIAAALLGQHLFHSHQGSARAVFLAIGILSFSTVMLGGYAREASRPRFVDRISHYDSVFVPEERQPYLMVDVSPDQIPKIEPRPEPSGPVALIRQKCSTCHTLTRVKDYELNRWALIVKQMVVYGAKLTPDETETVISYLESGKPY